MDPLRRNRTAAIAALGHIGIATKDVLAALERGLNDPQDDVRVFTSDAIGELGAKALPLLPTLLAHLDTTTSLFWNTKSKRLERWDAERERQSRLCGAGPTLMRRPRWDLPRALAG